MRFALFSTVPTVTLDLLGQLAAASEPELAHVAAAWSVVDKTIAPPAVRVVRAVSDLTDDDTPILFVPELPPEDADDLAFHYLQADRNGVQRPYGVVLAEPGMSWAMISQGAFHEKAETLADQMCSEYLAGFAREICDPVQNDGIVRDGILLSAWVTPAWFGIGTGPCAMSDEGFNLAPGALRPGGYVMHEDGTEEPPGYQPPSNKDHRHSRRARRRALLARRS